MQSGGLATSCQEIDQINASCFRAIESLLFAGFVVTLYSLAGFLALECARHGRGDGAPLWRLPVLRPTH